MQLTNEAAHDEINLFRLVRRLEKLAEGKEAWAGEPEDLWARSQKELQKVKFARKLVRNVEGYEPKTGASEHFKRLNGVKTTLDKVETFLNDRAPPPTPPRLPSLLDQLPPPPDENGFSEEEDGQMTPKAKEVPASLDLLAEDNFLLSPPEFQGLPSSGLVSAIPALMSAEPLGIPYRPIPSAASSTWTSLAPRSSTATTALDTTPALKHRATEAHSALQEELSSQLEHMAAQLKRNALHFASSLEKDKAVVEDAQAKLEGNLSFMEVQRVRLKTFAGKSGGTTWLTMGIVLFVILVFILMIGVIRLGRMV